MLKKLTLLILTLIIFTACGPQPKSDVFILREKGNNGDWIDTQLTTKYIEDVDVRTNESEIPYLVIRFDDNGKRIFAEITEKNIDKQIGIFVNEDLINAPMVKDKITGGYAQISGDMTMEEAERLKNILLTK